jgi:hypothetical protein
LFSFPLLVFGLKITKGLKYFFFSQVFIFKEDEEEEIELPFTEEELKDKFDGKLEKEMKGPSYEVLSKLLKVSIAIS